MNAKDTFWKNVERRIELNDMTINDLANKIHQTPSSFKKLWDKKANIGIESLTKYAEALNVQVFELLEDWTDQEWIENIGPSTRIEEGE